VREITASGQTVDEAVQSALEQLNTTKDHVNVQVIDEGKKGLLGIFGAKPAIVKVTLAKSQIEKAEEYLRDLIKQMNLVINISKTVDGHHVTFNLDGEKIALIIGKRGQTLNALQYLVHLIINRSGEDYYTVTLDAEGYRGRRRKTLEMLAMRMAEKAKRLNRKVALDPMPAFERKIIHSTLQQKENIKTYSSGEEPHRHIVISYQ